jgi:hypothetical protein
LHKDNAPEGKEGSFFTQSHVHNYIVLQEFQTFFSVPSLYTHAHYMQKLGGCGNENPSLIAVIEEHN